MAKKVNVSYTQNNGGGLAFNCSACGCDVIEFNNGDSVKCCPECGEEFEEEFE